MENTTFWYFMLEGGHSKSNHEDAVNFAGQGRNGVFCDLFPGEYTAESGFLLNSYLPSAVMLN